MAELKPPPPDVRFTLSIQRKDGTETQHNMVGWVQPPEPTEQPATQEQNQ